MSYYDDFKTVKKCFSLPAVTGTPDDDVCFKQTTWFEDLVNDLVRGPLITHLEKCLNLPHVVVTIDFTLPDGSIFTSKRMAIDPGINPDEKE
jgi:hypothetical protein